MESYLYKDILDTSKYFLGKYAMYFKPPNFRTQHRDHIFLIDLEYNYSVFLMFCSNHGFFNMSEDKLKTTYTMRGCMSYGNQEWENWQDEDRPDLEPTIQAQIQNKLELQLHRTLNPNTENYQTFYILLSGSGSQEETYLLGVYYEDEEGRVVFYFFNYIKDALLEQKEVYGQKNTVDADFCEKALKQMIAQKKQKVYTNVKAFSESFGVMYDTLITTFNRHHGHSLYEAYRIQRLIYGLELLLFMDLTGSEVSDKCHYNDYSDFGFYFTRKGLSPSRIKGIFDRKK